MLSRGMTRLVIEMLHQFNLKYDKESAEINWKWESNKTRQFTKQKGRRINECKEIALHDQMAW